MSARTEDLTTGSKKAVLARGVALLGAGLLVTTMVIGGSRAAFTGSTENDSNTWDAAHVAISDNDSGSALFSTDAMVPGDSDSGSIVVTYNGDAASVDVEMYATGYTSSDDGAPVTPEDFGELLNLTVGTTVGGSELYTGTVAGFAATHTDFASGAGTWAGAAPGASRTYYIEVELDSSASDAHQDGSAGVSFVWEAQTNATQS